MTCYLFIYYLTDCRGKYGGGRLQMYLNWTKNRRYINILNVCILFSTHVSTSHLAVCAQSRIFMSISSTKFDTYVTDFLLLYISFSIYSVFFLLSYTACQSLVLVLRLVLLLIDKFHVTDFSDAVYIYYIQINRNCDT